MLASVEKQKVVYVLNRISGDLTISSPLEANKGKTAAFDVCALDNGLENPGLGALSCFTEKDVDDPRSRRGSAEDADDTN